MITASSNKHGPSDIESPWRLDCHTLLPCYFLNLLYKVYLPMSFVRINCAYFARASVEERFLVWGHSSEDTVHRSKLQDEWLKVGTNANGPRNHPFETSPVFGTY
jgi:hypothetical protein